MRVTAGFLWALLLFSSTPAAGLQRQGAQSCSILSCSGTPLPSSAAAGRTPGATAWLSCRIPVFDRAGRSGSDAGDAGIARWAPGLRLRGGEGEGLSSLALMKPKFEGMDLAVPAAESGSTVSVRMVAPLMPTTLARLEERRNKGTLSAMEADAMNLLVIERRIEKNPEERKLKRLYKGSAIGQEVDALEAELVAAREEDAFEAELAQRERETAAEEEDERMGEPAGHGAVAVPGEAERLTQIEEKVALLIRVREELRLEKRYAEVQDVVRAEDGSVLAIVSNHSRWLDAIDDERLDDVDNWELGLYDGNTSRYTTAWSKKHLGTYLERTNRRAL
ncbi:hypothetical protein T484DRAFT_1848738 [Baffinella frigidus]|nr:hypothetical protein T484DRAFT_1848738 [Cryptophyta sp. CCMP2293]